MDLFGFIGDIKPIWLHDEVLPGQELPFGIVKLPRDLYKPWPIFEVGDGCSLIMRNAGGFRIENQIHSKLVL